MIQRKYGLTDNAAQNLFAAASSIEKLEVLAMLASAPGHRASIIDLARDARLPPAIAKRVVGELETAHLVDVNTRGQVLLAPRERDRAALEDLIAMYRSDPAYVGGVLARRR